VVLSASAVRDVCASVPAPIIPGVHEFIGKNSHACHRRQMNLAWKILPGFYRGSGHGRVLAECDIVHQFTTESNKFAYVLARGERPIRKDRLTVSDRLRAPGQHQFEYIIPS
jgi:hypothetical protein